ncbi:hypothetical protein SNE40_001430 [Patella caerulea]|uniref:Uncharacterized protein n=1 Tax=Patella caerulea TaxID=87958 RepID=A0AAN8KIM8_PATCE
MKNLKWIQTEAKRFLKTWPMQDTTNNKAPENGEYEIYHYKRETRKKYQASLNNKPASRKGYEALEKQRQITTTEMKKRLLSFETRNLSTDLNQKKQLQSSNNNEIINSDEKPEMDPDRSQEVFEDVAQDTTNNKAPENGEYEIYHYKRETRKQYQVSLNNKPASRKRYEALEKLRQITTTEMKKRLLSDSTIDPLPKTQKLPDS